MSIEEHRNVLRTSLRYNAPGLAAITIRLFHGEPPQGFPTDITYFVEEDRQIIKEGGEYTSGLTLTTNNKFFRYLVETLPPSVERSREAYGLERCYKAGMILLADRSPFFWANEQEKIAMLQRSDTEFKMFFPSLTPYDGLEVLGELEHDASVRRIYTRMIKKETNFFVNGVWMKTKESSEPSVTAAVGVKPGGTDNYKRLSNIMKEVKTAFLVSGESQRQTFRRNDGKKFSIEFKCVTN